MHPHPQAPPIDDDTLAEAARRRDAGRPVWQWFDRRIRGHMEANAGLPSQSAPPPRAGAWLEQRLTEASCKPRVMYVHVPFCKRICSFCAFFRKATASADLRAYTDALLKQIDRYAETRWTRSGPPFSAVYFGGGTPTALPADQLAQLIGAIRDRYPLRSDCEITVECRFDGLDEAYLDTLRSAGATRLSFGVQSFNTAVRQGVGRLADRQRVFDTLTTAGRMGFDSITVDLIYNLPGQTERSWFNDIIDLALTPATAASCYALIPMKGSALVKQIKLGRVESLGDVQHEYQLMRTAHELMGMRHGWRRFSFHHFGHADRERGVYNQTRSGGMDTLGFGSGGGGQIGDLSYMNPMNIEGFIEAQQAGHDSGVMASRQPAAARRFNRAYQLVEGDGIMRGELLNILPSFERSIDRLLNLELINEHHGRLSLTTDGCFWGYNLAALITGAIADALSADDAPSVSSMRHPHASPRFKHAAGA
ncbi:radical SAM protein [Planctomycetales bacterium ZRK34]|nr:radical SAM protein [Planctomycetales bacterium ZRK34]